MTLDSTFSIIWQTCLLQRIPDPTTCIEILLKVFGQRDVRDVLMNGKATCNGLTGLEFAVHIGSPLYFTKLLNREGIIKTTQLSITKRAILRGGNCEAEDIEENGYRVCEYNVTRYEMGDSLVDQGFLLKLISERDLLNMSDAETEAIQNCLFLKNLDESQDRQKPFHGKGCE